MLIGLNCRTPTWSLENWKVIIENTPKGYLLYLETEGMELKFFFQFSLVQLLSSVQLFATPWTAACQASLSIANSWSLLKLMSIETVMPFNHLILCCPFLLLPSIFPSITVFQMSQPFASGGQSIGVSAFQHQSFHEHPGLISFRMD